MIVIKCSLRRTHLYGFLGDKGNFGEDKVNIALGQVLLQWLLSIRGQVSADRPSSVSDNLRGRYHL